MFYVGESSVLEVGGGQILDNFCDPFLGHLQGPIQDATFADFDDFGSRLGSPWETFLGSLVDFWGVRVLIEFEVKPSSSNERGRRQGRGCSEPAKFARS